MKNGGRKWFLDRVFRDQRVKGVARKEKKRKNGKKSEKKKKVSENPHGSYSTAKLREKKSEKNFSVNITDDF